MPRHSQSVWQKRPWKKGYESAAKGLDKVSPQDLAGEKYALLITSTFGDGEPPENAKAFHAALLAQDAPRLENLSFSVCALGDTNYEKFCECGKEIDAGLQALGAKRLFERADCNVDFEDAYQGWQEGVFGVLDTMALPDAAGSPSHKAQSPAPLKRLDAPPKSAILARIPSKRPF